MTFTGVVGTWGLLHKDEVFKFAYIANLIKHAEFISDMYKYHYDYELNVGNQIWRYSSDSGAFYSPSEGKSFLINTPEKDKVSAILVKACLNAPVIENTSPVD